MSRKTFEALAAHLRATRPQGPPGEGSIQWCKDIAAVGQAIASVNRAFDARRFINNCLNSEVRK